MNKRLRKWGVFMESEEKNIYTEEKKVYTIEDIARELGVSKTTVSRAISGKGRIGQATRARVLQFIEEHDYRPNVMARGLAQKKTYNLALLLPKDYAATEFPFFKDCMNGICEVASSYDYDILIVRKDKYTVCIHCINCLEHIFRTRIHCLTAFDNIISSKFFENGIQSFTY